MVSDTSSTPAVVDTIVPQPPQPNAMDSATGHQLTAAIVFVHKGRRVIASRPMSHDVISPIFTSSLDRLLTNSDISTALQAAVTTSRRLFPSISASNKTLSFQTDELDICNGQLAEISPDIWESVIRSIQNLVVSEIVEEEDVQDSAVEDLSPPLIPNYTAERDHEGTFLDTRALPFDRYSDSAVPSPDCNEDTLTIQIMGELRELKVKRSEARTVQLLQAYLAEKLGTKPGEHILLKDGHFFSDSDRFSGVIEYRKRPVFSSPTMFIRTPTPVRVTVQVSLSSDLSFSGTAPNIPIKYRTATSQESLTWKVVAHPAGFLTDQGSGEEFQTLSWQAQQLQNTPNWTSNPGALASGKKLIRDDNSVVCGVKIWGTFGFESYLHRILATYGVPKSHHYNFTGVLKSRLQSENFSYVAWTILPKEELFQTAPLDITPFPDVLTRFFILYQGVHADELDQWPHARTRSNNMDMSWCSDILGTDPVRACDETLFRVVEVGAMEISR